MAIKKVSTSVKTVHLAISEKEFVYDAAREQLTLRIPVETHEIPHELTKELGDRVEALYDEKAADRVLMALYEAMEEEGVQYFFRTRRIRGDR